MSNLKHWIWLTQRRGIPGQIAVRLLERFGSPEQIHAADRGAFETLGGLSGEAVRSLMEKSLDGADRILGDCDRLGIRLLTLQDATYPERLKAIHQPPMVLYWKGRQFAFDEEVAIAMVGARKATPYGVDTASRLAGELSRRGALIVSGMAEGIDATAVRGALKAGGPVVSVIAGGLDRIYPAFHRELYEDVAAVGAMFSEYPPGTEHRGSHFPIRNRIISGLSLGVLAVECKRSSGTMLTINHALEQGREVYAVPVGLDEQCARGTNQLIRDFKARLVENAGDILRDYVDRFPTRLAKLAPLPPSVVSARLSGDKPREAPAQKVTGLEFLRAIRARL